MASTAHSTRPAGCYLLSIPRELRDEIWSLSLTDDTTIIDKHGSQVIRLDKSYTPPALLGTCRQIRTETSEIYYGKTIFLSKAPTNSSSTWLDVLPTAAISHLKFLGLVETPPLRLGPSFPQTNASWGTFLTATDHSQIGPVFGNVGILDLSGVAAPRKEKEKAGDRKCLLTKVASFGVSPKAVKFLTPDGYGIYKVEDVDGDGGVLSLREPEFGEGDEMPPLVGEDGVVIGGMD